MSTLFAEVNKCLGIKHITSAARTARSNGMAEATVKRLSEHLKFYGKDDLSIEDTIPIIELNLRGINSLIVPKLVQLPQIEEILDDMCSKRPSIFTCLLYTSPSPRD